MAGLHRGDRPHRGRGDPTAGAGPRRLRERRRGSHRGHRRRSRAVLPASSSVQPMPSPRSARSAGSPSAAPRRSAPAPSTPPPSVCTASTGRPSSPSPSWPPSSSAGAPSRWPVRAGSSSRSARSPTSAIFGGWVLAKTSGISFIDGLGEAESPQLADSLAAGLAVVAVLAAVAPPLLLGLRVPLKRQPAAHRCRRDRGRRRWRCPGMIAAGSHSHAGGHGTTTAAAAHSHGDGAADRAHRRRRAAQGLRPHAAHRSRRRRGRHAPAAGGGREPPGHHPHRAPAVLRPGRRREHGLRVDRRRLPRPRALPQRRQHERRQDPRPRLPRVARLRHLASRRRSWWRPCS